jgi:hypothetical protein
VLAVLGVDVWIGVVAFAIAPVAQSAALDRVKASPPITGQVPSKTIGCPATSGIAANSWSDRGIWDVDAALLCHHRVIYEAGEAPFFFALDHATLEVAIFTDRLTALGLAGEPGGVFNADSDRADEFETNVVNGNVRCLQGATNEKHLAGELAGAVLAISKMIADTYFAALVDETGKMRMLDGHL